MLVRKFEQQVLEHPQNIAIKTAYSQITYNQLNNYANGVAYEIIGKINKYSKDKSMNNIALLFEHGIDMIVGTIGALKTGKIYIPFDPTYPVKRLEYMLKDSEAKVILTNSKNLDLAMRLSRESDIPIIVLNIDDIDCPKEAINLNIDIDENDIAYILYTSGSTGIPKGVFQSHKNIFHFIKCYSKTMHISSQDKMTLFSAFSHDAAVMDIYSALLNGAALYPLNIKDRGKFYELSSWLKEEEITIWHSVPTLYRYFINALNEKESFPSLRFIVLGGEIVIEHDVEMFKKLFSNTKLVNLYGQTESSFNSAQIFTADSKSNKIVLGAPVEETELLVVNENNEEVSVLEEGEIVILSDYIACGYWKDEEKTRSVFRYSHEIGKLYWTGDLGLLLPDGTIKFAGRKGSVVKIRGYRVDTGEVESQLLKYEAIKEAVVLAKKDENENDDFLCAYIVTEEKIEIGTLKNYLSEFLPEYMIPTYFTKLENMPLTPNGKLNRKALSELEYNIVSGVSYEAPRNEIEERLVTIWGEILQVDKVGINDNFFELGGHSLKATMLTSRCCNEFGIEIHLREILKNPTIKGISEYISSSGESFVNYIEPVEKRDYYQVSSSQRRMFILNQLNPDNTNYNMPMILRVEGKLNIDKVEKAMHALIQRHESLRTSFHIEDRGIIQRIDAIPKVNIKYSQAEDKNIDEIIQSFIRPFNLAISPLVRLEVVTLSEDSHLLMFDIHHIISDGTSTGILIYEFAKLYDNETLEDLSIQYKDYAEWQNSLLKSEEMRAQEEYWINKFSGEIPVLNLRYDFTRPVIQTFEGDSVKFLLDEEITNRLQKIAAKTGSTMYMILLSALNILLSKYSGQEDIIVGSPIAGRNHPGLDEIIGIFVNTLAMRNFPLGNKSYEEFLKDVKKNALEAYENQDYQFEELIDKLKLKRDISRNPLFDVMFNMQNIDRKKMRLNELEFKDYERNKKISKFDLSFIAYEVGEEILMEIEYCTKLFKKVTIESMKEHFINILSAICENTNAQLREINILSQAEKDKLLYEFNDTYSDYSKEAVIQELFEAQVEKTPDNVALISEEKQITYDELNRRTNSLARKLRKMGVNRGSIVGIQIERSVEMLVGILAVLKAGGAYLPIDPEYPEDRVSYMLGDSKAEILLVKGSLENDQINTSLDGKIDFNGQILDLKQEKNYTEDCDNLEIINSSKDLAYVIYTSGSTGKPKGVMIEHKQVNNFLEGVVKATDLTSYESILCITTISFDIFVLETLVPLAKGLRLVIANENEQIDGEKLGELILKNKIEVMQSTPSRVQLLIENNKFKDSLANLRMLMVGGDSLPINLLGQLQQYDSLKIFNMYGPTETTVWSTIKDLTLSEEVNIGKPIQNTKIYILDKQNRLQPIGAVGEICIAGEGVARGYLNREELTKEKFVKNPFASGERMYKTGDLGSWLFSGDIEILGRIDNQVKIRGFRIELGEIEENLLKHEAVKEAVVLDKEDGNGVKYLCAYIVGTREITAKKLIEYLVNNIPDYMIPSYFMQIDEMPLTPNGKIDRRALRQLEGGMSFGTSYEAPRNEIEEKLAEIWSEILEASEIGINHNFFELGGHSLKAAILVSRCLKEFNVEIPLGEIFKSPTIMGLSEYISRNGAAGVNYIEAADDREFYPVSSSQRRMFILNQLNPDNTNYNMPMVFKAEGKLDIDKLEKAMRALLQRHESLRTSFHIENEEIVQRIHAESAVNIVYSKAEGKSKEELIQSFIKPFNLAVSPLLRLEVVTLSQDSYLLMFDVHHIVSDGFSTGILIKEFMELYEGKVLHDLKLQYKDYSVWEDKLFKSGEMKKQEEYWMNLFKEEPEKLNMPLDFIRPKYQTFNGNRLKFEIAKDIVEKMEVIGKKQGATLNMVLCSVFNVLLHKYSGQEDITTGIVMAGRRHPYLDSIIGVFINFLPIRSIINPGLTFNEFLSAEKAVITGAYDNENYPFDEIVAKVVKEQDEGRNPVFDSMFILHNEYDAQKQYKLADINFEGIEINKYNSKLDFQIDAAVDIEGNLKCSLEYNTNLFKEEIMRGFIKHFEMLLDKIGDNSEVMISDLNIFEEHELQAIEKRRRNNCQSSDKLSIVVTSTFTDEPVGEYIKWWCKKFKQDAKIQFAPYNQVFQQLLDKSSLVSKNNGMSVILVRFEDWIRDIKAGEKEKCSMLEKNYEDLLEALKGKRADSVYLIGIFPSADSSIKTKNALGSEVLECIQKLKLRMEKELKQIKNIFTVDLRDINKLYSIKEVYDPYRDKVGHVPFTDEFYAAMGTTIARKICALRRTPFKVIVLDCDNTLWKGVCGEDGTLGVKVTKDYEEFQKMLLQKHDEGMLLALCSKNNEKDVWEVFEKNNGMLLKKEHLAAWRINWNSKSENIKELAEELNLGVDSFIFMDDSPVECSEVMTNVPEVLTLQIPTDSKAIPMYIRHVWAFDRAIVTKEDRVRTQMYTAERERKSLLNKNTSIEDFLRSLQLKMSMNLIQEENIARAYQMTQRTNQFNLSTIRRTEEELRTLLSNQNIVSWVMEVKDRFGDYGLVGLVIGEKRDTSLFIDTFLLSCRALGRCIEDAILVGLVDYCKNEKLKTIVADYYPTAKNKPFLEFLEKGLWNKAKQTEAYIEFKIDINKFDRQVDFIDCYYNSSYKQEEDGYKEFKEESACSRDNSQDSAVVALAEGEEPCWEVNIPDGETLKYTEYLLALGNYSGKRLLQLPVTEENSLKLIPIQEYEGPRNEIEERLIKIWTEILKVPGIGINHNFFQLGGHSLKATFLVSKIHKEFNVEVPLGELFKSPTIKEISEYIKSLEKNIFKNIEKAKEKEYYEASLVQNRMYMLQQTDLQSVGYNMPGAIEILGDLDLTRLEEAVKEVIKRHDSLRTFFNIAEGKLVQVINKEVDFEIEYIESLDLDLKEFIKGFVRPFDLEFAPLLRMCIIRLERNKYVLLFDMHHIISDGLSISIMGDEIFRLYAGEALDELKLQYKDYSEWQRVLIESGRFQRQEDYWINKFSDEIPILNMPTDFERPAIKGFDGDIVSARLKDELVKSLKELVRETGSTMYIVMLSAFNILLSKYSGQEDVIIGTPTSGRTHAELEGIIGMFVNTLVMRNYPVKDKTCEEFLKEVKENSLKAFENQDYEFRELLDKLKLRRDFSRNPLFDVMFAMQSMEIGKNELNGLTFNSYPVKHNVAKLDLTFTVKEAPSDILIVTQYDISLFKKETIERMMEHLINILNQMVTNPNMKLSTIDMLSPEERNKLLYEFNNTNFDYPKDKPIHKLFEDQARKTPENIALVFNEEKLTYRELNIKSNKLAKNLREKGVKKDSTVALIAESSLEMIIGMMGILKAGGAYLPISHEYPEDRIRYILDDSKTNIILTQSKFLELVPFNMEILDLCDESVYVGDGEELSSVNSLSDLAYVIYTSGTTGKPKGVMIEHKNLLAYVNAFLHEYKLGEEDNILQQANYSFDAFVEEVYPALTVGGKVFIVNKYDVLNISYLQEFIFNNKINLISCSPLFINELNKCHKLESIHTFISGGDVLKKEYFNNLIRYSKVYNTCGPTETTVCFSYYKCLEDINGNIPIGKPIANYQVYILDISGNLAPVGVVGEICVSGDGVARGYLNSPELTAQRFVVNPFKPGEKMYKTGDLGRWLPDGNLEFLGRVDHQVKIRGFRIEIGEIEDQLLNYEGIKEAVVLDREDNNGGKYLCAYIASDKELTAKELRESLSKNLPEYMIPSYFILLEKIPQTPNGKVDREALMELDANIVTGSEYEAPRNEIEGKVADIWRQVLGVERVGINDNFFDLGGHSLKATTLIGRLHKEFNVQIPLREVFISPTIKGISKYIEKTEKSIYKSIRPVEEKEYYEASSAQKRMYMLQQFNIYSTVYNMPIAMEVGGKLEFERLQYVMNTLIERHEALRTYFEMTEMGIVQRISKETKFEIEYIQGFEEVEDEDAATQLRTCRENSIDQIVKKFVRAFDLSKAPLLRVGLIKVNSESHILMFDIHHIISDGVSMGILISEFVKLYQGEQLRELKLQYKDYSHWQNNLMKSDDMKKQEEYWLNRFNGEIPVLNLRTDYQRPSIKSFEGDKIGFILDKELTKKLNKLISETRSTMYMLILSVINILLSKYTGQEDIVVGSPIAGRPHTDLQGIIGIFLNTLAMRNEPKGEKTYEEFLKEVKENALMAYENQDYPFEELVDKLKVTRDMGRNPLFDVMFVLQNVEREAINFQEGTFKLYKSENKTAKFDLSITAVPMREEMALSIEYSTRLFKKETIKEMTDYLVNIFNIIADDRKIYIKDIELQSVEEKHKLLYEFNNTSAEYPREKTIYELFEEQAEKTPTNISIICGGERLTYEELNQKANSLARTLRAKGVGSDDIVGIMMERSIEMMVGIMAILKAGGAYLPIDPDYPEDRVKYMFEDSKTMLLLSQKHLMEKISFSGEIVDLLDSTVYSENKSNLEKVSTCKNLAYIIYTSGSTGKPKGVMIEHHSVINRLNWMQKSYNLQSGDVILQKTPFTFDVSVWELFWWSFYGASVCLLKPRGEKDPEAIMEAIEKNRITTLHFVPSMLSAFLEFVRNDEDIRKLSSIRRVFSSGEAINGYQVEMFNEKLGKTNNSKLINLYGPTEATVDVSYFNCDEGYKSGNIPIGKPIDNIQLYVVDKNYKLQPVGIPGELCIAGVGLARGYLNNAELTAEKFVENPFTRGSRMYRTGDLARWLHDGNIEFLGRIDYQVKVRGFRIELGEIESNILGYSGVKEAVVIDREDDGGNKYLCAYLVADNKIEASEIKQHLLKKLPEYMIPAYFIQLDSIPLTSNGKLDRKALPKPEGSINRSSEYEAPRNEIEYKICRVWQEVLGIEKVGINDNFFDIGGDSIKAVRAVSRSEGKYSLVDLYNNSNIKKLSDLKGISNNSLLVKLTNTNNIKSEDAVSLVCIPYGGGSAIVFKDLADSLSKISDRFTLYSINLPGHDISNPSDECKNIKDIAKLCVEEIKIKVKSPVVLYGHCVGSALTIEIARLLEQDEIPVELVYMGGVFPPKFGILTDKSKALDPWRAYSDEHIRDFLTSIGGFKQAMEVEELKFIMECFRNDVKISQEYFYNNYKEKVNNKISAPICSIVGGKDPLTKGYDKKYRKWSQYSKNEVRLYVIPEGDHYFTKNNSDELADIISKTINSQINQK